MGIEDLTLDLLAVWLPAWILIAALATAERIWIWIRGGAE